MFANFFAKNSSDENFEADFLVHKNSEEKRDYVHLDTTDSENSDALNIQISIDELKDALKTCKNSSQSPDEIPNVFLKNLPLNSLNYLLEIYNYIFSKGVFPKKWQEAIVVPILKPGKDRSKIESYRPIYLTC